MTTLNDLSKEDLINVIAHMHDTIQHWNDGWGFGQDEAHVLNTVGNLCTAHMVETQDRSWKLPTIEPTID